MKRLFDLFCSSIGLILLFPLFIVITISIKLDSQGPIFFRQVRIGKNFKPFSIYKFRSMRVDSPLKGPLFTAEGDNRVTGTGKILRKTKIDELPQLINVFKGKMSLVGPRPEVKKYVELFRSDYEKLLRVRPGITDPASIKFTHEENLLNKSTDHERDYIARILPEKIRLASGYVDNNSVFSDFKFILKTIIKI